MKLHYLVPGKSCFAAATSCAGLRSPPPGPTRGTAPAARHRSNPSPRAHKIPGTIARAVQVQQAGYDSILLGCYAGPGDALREVRTIPVAGPLESSAATALTLGHRFSIVIAGNAPVR